MKFRIPHRHRHTAGVGKLNRASNVAIFRQTIEYVMSGLQRHVIGRFSGKAGVDKSPSLVLAGYYNFAFLVSFCHSASFALQHGGFAPRERLATKALLPSISYWSSGRVDACLKLSSIVQGQQCWYV